jgi:hypothetical protein
MGTTMRRVGRLVGGCVLAAAIPIIAWAQAIRGVVLDQTDLPLPGVTIQLLDGAMIVRSFVTEADGSFSIDATLHGDVLLLSLEGFESKRVPRSESDRIVLQIARTTESTTVLAPALIESSPTAVLLGSTLAASTVARLPSAHMKARESLPLLPSVIRGADGLMQLGGARAHQTPLTLDGFNVTDPATGISSVNLPFEVVKGIDALRDPMAVTYGGLLGGVVKVESKSGGKDFSKGVQGFVPRPRFATPGFGRIEGIFPRAHVAGSIATGRIQYIAAGEYDYERIPVPEVTQKDGSALVDQSAVFFARVDAALTERHEITVEGFSFPTSTRSFGLGPRRDASATVDLRATDLFAGITDRLLSETAGLFTIQVGVLARDADVVPNGLGPSRLSPSSWSGNWFSTVSRSAVRYSAAASWERVLRPGTRPHDVTLTGEIAARRLSGHVQEQPVIVSDAAERPVRSVEFGPAATFGARDWPVGLALRDVWQVHPRLQIDGGVRVDHSRHGGGAPSGRAGVRYALDASGKTVAKGGYGSFIGALPLTAPAFAGYPSRVDRWLDGATGEVVREVTFRPAIGRLRLPRALAAVVGLERELSAGLDVQVVLTSRHSSRLATLRVPNESGDLTLDSAGTGSYREVQISARRTLTNDQQLFVSYVRSAADGELNEFASLFQAMDAPLLLKGGRARMPSDAHHRVLAWGTFDLPRRVVVSPATEWRSGFPYSSLTARYAYAGSPNARTFPAFFSADIVVYKTLTVKRRSADVGIQLFNVTNHRNFRDVYPVIGAPRAGQFANSVGPILRGYMLLKW